MLSLFGKPARLGAGIGRREVMRIGGLSTLGLSLPTLLTGQAYSAPTPTGSTFGRAKNVIFLWLQGGPPQHETFDPKPDAPAEIRGDFKPIATNVPGINLCELLPRTAGIVDKLAIVRSLSTNNNLHDASGYHVLTGYPYQGGNSRQISTSDWPYLGSVIKMLRPSPLLPAYTSVWLPDVMRLNDNAQPAGQTAGFLGKRWEPERIIWDSQDPSAQIAKFKRQHDVTPLRLSDRARLLDQVDRQLRGIEQGGVLDQYDRQVREAFGVLSSGRAFAAFDIDREPSHVRDRYGRNEWGQCVLLARRLVEAGVRLVHVNWPRESGDSAVDNPMWDTHAQNADRLQGVLCPIFDVGFTALIEDLGQRGLLDETLVVAIGEFGRTPKINSQGGRDHWGHVFSFALAGAGIRTAQVYGESDKSGAYPRLNPVGPEDLTATIFHLLGIGHHAMFRDRANRPLPVTHGSPIDRILGTEPATLDRQPAAGNLAMAPAYTTDKLLNTRFDAGTPLVPIGSSRRLKGWQALPIATGNGFGVRLLDGKGSSGVAIGISASGKIAKGERAILTQEIRNPRPGQFTLTVKARGAASSADLYHRFMSGLACKLVIFRYSDSTKDPRRAQELGSLLFSPAFVEPGKADLETFELVAVLDSRVPGVNFRIGNGLGIALVVEKVSPEPFELPAGSGAAFLHIVEARLDFLGRTRNDENME